MKKNFALTFTDFNVTLSTVNQGNYHNLNITVSLLNQARICQINKKNVLFCAWIYMHEDTLQICFSNTISQKVKRVNILNYCMYADKYFHDLLLSHLSVTLICLSWSLTVAEVWFTSKVFSVFTKSSEIICNCSSTAATATCRIK